MKIWGGTVKSYMINLFKYIPIFSQKFPVCVMFVGCSSLVVSHNLLPRTSLTK